MLVISSTAAPVSRIPTTSRCIRAAPASVIDADRKQLVTGMYGMSSLDAPSPIVPPRARERPIIIVGLAALAALALVLVPGLGLLSYPFRLLITIVHELSHGLVALLTGGAFLRFVVFADGEGVAYTVGGWRLLVIPAGYLGSALFGASLIHLGRSMRWSRAAMAVLGAALLLLSLRYGLPSIATVQWSSGVITVVAGLAIGTWWRFRPA